MFKGDLVIPVKVTQQDILKTVHEPHQGIVQRKQHTGYVLDWPQMSSETEDIVRKSADCQENRS